MDSPASKVPGNWIDEEEPITALQQHWYWSADNIPAFLKLKTVDARQFFNNNVHPENLTKLHHLKGQEDRDCNKDENIENGLVKLKEKK